MERIDMDKEKTNRYLSPIISVSGPGTDHFVSFCGLGFLCPETDIYMLLSRNWTVLSDSVATDFWSPKLMYFFHYGRVNLDEAEMRIVGSKGGTPPDSKAGKLGTILLMTLNLPHFW